MSASEQNSSDSFCQNATMDGPKSIDDIVAQLEIGLPVPLPDGRDVVVRGVVVERVDLDEPDRLARDILPWRSK